MQCLNVGEQKCGEDLGDKKCHDQENIHEDVVVGEWLQVDKVHVEENGKGALDCIKDQLLYTVCVEANTENHI